MGMSNAISGKLRAWRRRGKYVYKYVFGDGERQDDLNWLTCLMLFVMCASEAGGWLVGCL